MVSYTHPCHFYIGQIPPPLPRAASTTEISFLHNLSIYFVWTCFSRGQHSPRLRNLICCRCIFKHNTKQENSLHTSHE